MYISWYCKNQQYVAGARGSRDSCQMNYPSKNSSHHVNCHVVDPTNPSFNLQRGIASRPPPILASRLFSPIYDDAFDSFHDCAVGHQAGRNALPRGKLNEVWVVFRSFRSGIIWSPIISNDILLVCAYPGKRANSRNFLEKLLG